MLLDAIILYTARGRSTNRFLKELKRNPSPSLGQEDPLAILPISVNTNAIPI